MAERDVRLHFAGDPCEVEPAVIASVIALSVEQQGDAGRSQGTVAKLQAQMPAVDHELRLLDRAGNFRGDEPLSERGGACARAQVAIEERAPNAELQHRVRVQRERQAGPSALEPVACPVVRTRVVAEPEEAHRTEVSVPDVDLHSERESAGSGWKDGLSVERLVGRRGHATRETEAETLARRPLHHAGAEHEARTGRQATDHRKHAVRWREEALRKMPLLESEQPRLPGRQVLRSEILSLCLPLLEQNLLASLGRLSRRLGAGHPRHREQRGS